MNTKKNCLELSWLHGPCVILNQILKLPNVWVTLVSKVSFNFEVFSLMMPLIQYHDFLFSNLSCSYAWGFNSRENNALLSWAYLHISFLTAYFKVKAIKHISGKQNDFLKILISSVFTLIPNLFLMGHSVQE